ncbi:MAG: hypothetical protein COA38_09345 [Fluviicola sp.]|nr:MAG: hypothetical protein COA38_09345 [Fluviicola sp.]
MKALTLTLKSWILSDFIGNGIRFVLRNKIQFHNGYLNVSSMSIRGKIVALLFFSKYEKEEIQLIQSHMRPDLPIIDLGASIGAVSMNAAQLSTQNIICVEANPALIDVIQLNLLENQIGPDRFEILNCAVVGEKEDGETVHFETRGSNELGKLTDCKTNSSIDVKGSSLGKLVKSRKLDEFILISDIEGAEAAFLFHDDNCLDKCDQLFIELHSVIWNGRKLEIQDFVNRILSLGFSLVEQVKANFYFKKDV